MLIKNFCQDRLDIEILNSAYYVHKISELI